jgi:predicted transcriptional regulator
MGCIDPDGSLNASATLLLETLAQGPLQLTQITVLLKVPGFMARANLRELVEMGLIAEEEGMYHITEEGRKQG